LLQEQIKKINFFYKNKTDYFHHSSLLDTCISKRYEKRLSRTQFPFLKLHTHAHAAREVADARRRRPKLACKSSNFLADSRRWLLLKKRCPFSGRSVRSFALAQEREGWKAALAAAEAATPLCVREVSLGYTITFGYRFIPLYVYVHKEEKKVPSQRQRRGC